MKGMYRLNTGYPNTPTNTHVDFSLHSTLDRIAHHVRTFYLSVIQGFSRQVATEVEKNRIQPVGKGLHRQLHTKELSMRQKYIGSIDLKVGPGNGSHSTGGRSGYCCALCTLLRGSPKTGMNEDCVLLRPVQTSRRANIRSALRRWQLSSSTTTIGGGITLTQYYMYSFHIAVFCMRLLTTDAISSFEKPDCTVSYCERPQYDSPPL
jgi:hypothetical protein